MPAEDPGRGDRRLPPAGREAKAVAMVLGSSTSLQFGAALAVILLYRIGPVGAVTLRLVLATALVWLFVRPRFRLRSRSDLAMGVLFGLVLAAMNLCYYEAAARVPLGAAVTLEFTGPLGLAVALSRRPKDVAWVLLAAGGVLLLSEGGLEPLNPVGMAFGFAAGACWALYILLAARVGRVFPGGQGMAVALLAGSLAILPLWATTSGWSGWTLGVLLLGLCVAAMSSAVPYTMELAALRRIPAGTFGVLMSLQPAVAAVAGFLVLGQHLTPWQLLAIGLVVVASAGATWSARVPSPGG